MFLLDFVSNVSDPLGWLSGLEWEEFLEGSHGSFHSSMVILVANWLFVNSFANFTASLFSVKQQETFHIGIEEG